ncbi:hypothetical protein DUI87_21651 [Hirundo rustica rustica]|uniref:Uncharacterized protein n=1 Tax=Hirundo rustica rustica TaxID=333673 RepID=A0A3M0JKM4_HIRRU|nr:hypothetical protein DUI87_21651 [Hirundo rustica rustica]
MPPLQWLVDRPIWENQRPLPHDKLITLRELVQEQLEQGHLEPSTSPWNTPVFCIKKKSGKWRLLQDLRKINAMMEGMGTLQAAHALSGVHKQFPSAHVYHYMDDILVAAPTQDELLRIQPQLLNTLHSHGLQVAPEKVQPQPPWKYLGVKILERTIRHQEVQFVQSVKTLNDAQKLVGVTTWLRPYLGLTTAQLSPSFELLKGDTDLKSPHEFTPEARKVLEEVQQAVFARQVYRIEPSIDVTVFITTPDLHPTGIISQWNDDWTDPLHIVEWVFLPHQPHKMVMALFELIACLIIKCWQRCLPEFIHTTFCMNRVTLTCTGFVAEGNARADKLANPAWVAPQPDVLVQAKASHGFFHQNAHTLQKQFQLTATEAREIVKSCDNRHALGAPLPAGVNPRGLKALELWQTDVTQVAKFGWLKYVHVTVDTFSSVMWTSAHTGEKACDVIAHWRQAFAVLGIPSAVKTDNGPAYASQQARQFRQSWGVSHNFGIPHSPTGQEIIECAHGTLKCVLQKQKQGMQGETPHSRLAKTLYTINHLTVPQNSNNPVILNHHLSLQASDGEQQPQAKV